MKVGLFIPCYIDAFFPEVGVATLELLEEVTQATIINAVRVGRDADVSAAALTTT